MNGKTLGAVAYRSVAHIPRSDNVAIQPSVVDRCLQLRNVREMEITDKDGESRTVREVDFSSTFDGGQILWTGRPAQWTLQQGEELKFSVESGAWVARSLDGNVVDPA